MSDKVNESALFMVKWRHKGAVLLMGKISEQMRILLIDINEFEPANYFVLLRETGTYKG